MAFRNQADREIIQSTKTTHKQIFVEWILLYILKMSSLVHYKLLSSIPDRECTNFFHQIKHQNFLDAKNSRMIDQV